MNILTTEYSLRHEALEVYLSGCNGPHCPGCHNKESWDFGVGRPFGDCIHELEDKITSYGDLIENIWILGGEPLDQPHDKLENLLIALHRYGKPIWLFTRYSLDEVPKGIRFWCSYIKTGRYDRNLLTEQNIQYGVKLASSNQEIHCLI